MTAKENNQPHAIMFHHFHDFKKHPKSQGSITGEQLDKMIIWLKEKFSLLSADEWYDKAISGRLTKKDVCLSFDDNLLCQFEIALPVLEKHNLKSFWFIYTTPLQGEKEKLEIYRYFRTVYFKEINDFYDSFNKEIEDSRYRNQVQKKLKDLDLNTYLSAFPFYSKEDKIFRYIRDKILNHDNYFEIMDKMISKSGLNEDEVSKILWNTSDNIKKLKQAGHIIGLHSHSHPTDLRSLSFNDQLYEYEANKQILKSIINDDIIAMSHPCNSYDDTTLEILRKLGIKMGFRSIMPGGGKSPLEYPRLDHALLIDKII